MRGFLVGAIVFVAACGGGGEEGGGGDAVRCSQDASSFHRIVDATQACTQDSDCTVVIDSCFGPAFCGAYVTVANADAVRALVADGRIVCSDCVQCAQPLPAACVMGRCAATPPPH